MMYRWRKELWWLLILMIVVLILYQITAIREDQEWQRNQEIQMHYETFEQIRKLEKQVNSLEKRIDEFMNKWNIEPVEITGYAPLDPRAVEGVCYEGDPGVTASGEPTQIGVSVAAGLDVPFGTKVWIDGYG